MTTRLLLILLGLTFLAPYSGAGQDTLFVESFESGSSTFILNTNDSGSVGLAGYNEWVINNAYTGGSANTSCAGMPHLHNFANTTAQPAGIINSPTSTYLHTVSEAALNNNVFCSTYGFESTFCPVDERYFAAMDSDLNTWGMDSVELSFWWMCGGDTAAYGELYYSLDQGMSWAPAPLGQGIYHNQSIWTQEVISTAAWAHQPTLRFGFRFVNELAATTIDPGFSIDDITVVTMPGCINPEALFTYSVSNTLDYTFQENALTIGANVSYYWDFGNGQVFFSPNPTVTFLPGQSVTACFAVTDSCFSDTLCQSFTVGCPPIALDFSYSSTELLATFNNLTPPGAYSYEWDFGDGSTDTASHPTHLFPGPGSYVVCLTGVDSCAFPVYCDTITITCSNPVASFASSSSTYSTLFNDQSVGAVAGSTYLWNFGDSTSGTGANPIHTYDSVGSYWACMTIANACGVDSFCDSVMVVCPLPSIGFTQDFGNMTVAFTNQSTTADTLANWNWDFGDGTFGTAANPLHLFDSIGTYLVCLTLQDECGSDTLCQNVSVCQNPITSFIYNNVFGTFDFTDLTLGPEIDFWQWDFGDGNTSALQNPTHSYSAGGTYTACLVSGNACDVDSTCTLVSVLTSDINEGALLAHLKVFPNPVNQRLQLALPSWEEAYHLQFTDATGRVVFEQQMHAGQQWELVLPELADGLYHLVLSRDGQRSARKIVVRH